MRRVRPENVSSRSASKPQDALCFNRVDPNKPFCIEFLSDFDLSFDVSHLFRIYVLKCQHGQMLGSVAYYVGIIEKGSLLERLEKHRSQRNCPLFTRVHKPLGVELLSSATLRAAEGYLFMYLLGKFPHEEMRKTQIGNNF